MKHIINSYIYKHIIISLFNIDIINYILNYILYINLKIKINHLCYKLSCFIFLINI